MSLSKSRIVALIPSFNAGEFLLLSVESLLEQSRPADRIVIIDDASTDGSMDSIRHLAADDRIEIFQNEENCGKADSLNRQFDRIDCDYFLIQDADDIAFPTRIERQLAFMEENPRLGCSSGFIEYINKNGKRIGEGKLDLLEERKLSDYLSGDDPFGLFCPAAIVKADAVKDKALQFRKRFWPADDIDLWNRIAEAGWLVLAQPENLVGYRIHGASAVTSSFYRTRMQFEWVRACLRARRRKLPEPGREQFLATWNGIGKIPKLNRWRKMTAKAHYRNAGFKIAEKQIATGAASLFLSLLLQPSYFISRLSKQIGRTTA